MYFFSRSFISFYNDQVTARSKMPKDVIEISKATYDAMMLSLQNGLVIKVAANGQPSAGKAPPHVPAKEKLQEQLDRYALDLKNKIHDLAREWEYDSSHTASTYLHSNIAIFALEAKAIIEYRDKAWHNANVLITRIKEGTSKIPATSEDFLAIVLPPAPQRPKA